MRLAHPIAALLALLHGACEPAAATGEHDRPQPTAHRLQSVSTRGCACQVDRRGPGRDQADCHAAGLPEDGALCQRGANGIYCGPVGENPATFIGTAGCGEGFCASVDGETCLFTCGCE